MVDRLRSLPMARSAVLIGRTAADLVTNVFTLIVMVAVGLLVGFRPAQPAWQFAAAFVLVLGFSYVFSWISAWVGLSVRNPETAASPWAGRRRPHRPSRRSRGSPPSC